jgi:hypothetical protein
MDATALDPMATLFVLFAFAWGPSATAVVLALEK